LPLGPHRVYPGTPGRNTKYEIPLHPIRNTKTAERKKQQGPIPFDLE